MHVISYFKGFNKKINGGTNVPHRKNTQHVHSEKMPCSPYVVLPMQQHIGSECIPTVKLNDTVKIGQEIAKGSSNFSAPIHASISGRISKIDKILMPNGTYSKAVTIESDNKMELFESLKKHNITTKKDLVRAAKDCGLVGLGGAGFPTHIKLNIPEDKHIDTLLINAAECEPYITSDNRTIIENTDHIINGVNLIKKTLNIKSAIIAIEKNKPEAIKKLKLAISQSSSEINVMTLDTRYPQGAEKVLIKVSTKRVVPCGKLPSDVGCLVMNVSSVFTLYNYITTGLPLVNRTITVDGSAINSPKNVIVPIGTPINEVIKFCGGYKKPAKKILMGGPMMGIALTDDTMPILKQNNAILVLDEKDSKLPKETACIRCGKCVKSCPMNLMPLAFEQHVKKGAFENLIKLNINNCMECGSCAFSCPANRPLVQYIRTGKFLIKKNKIK